MSAKGKGKAAAVTSRSGATSQLSPKTPKDLEKLAGQPLLIRTASDQAVSPKPSYLWPLVAVLCVVACVVAVIVDRKMARSPTATPGTFSFLAAAGGGIEKANFSLSANFGQMASMQLFCPYASRTPIDLSVLKVVPYLVPKTSTGYAAYKTSGSYQVVSDQSLGAVLQVSLARTDLFTFEIALAMVKPSGDVACQHYIDVTPFVAANESYHILATEQPGPQPDLVWMYTNVTWTFLDKRFWNGLPDQPVYRVSVSGVYLRWYQQDIVNIFRIEQPRNVAEVFITADVFQLFYPLVIPSATVSVFARVVDLVGPGQIVTTPIPRSPAPQTGQAGEAGAPAGNIAVYSDSLLLDRSTATNHFVTRGGVGQEPGKGADGTPGHSIPTVTFSQRCTGGSSCGDGSAGRWPDLIYFRYHDAVYTRCSDQGKYYQDFPHDRPGCPTSGQNAGNPGRSGDGGNAGSLIIRATSAAVCTKVTSDRAGGDAGPSGKPGQGGAFGTPKRARWGECWIWGSEPGRVGCQYSDDPPHCTNGGGYHCPETQPGSPSTSFPRGSPGAAGGIDCSAAPSTWLNPVLLNVMEAYISDQYRAQLYQATFDNVTTYIAALDSSNAAWAPILRQKFDLVRHRLQAQVDFYGNPLAWVPPLSFLMNAQLYTNEINDYMRVLYLSTWISIVEQTIQTRRAALRELMSNLIQELQALNDKLPPALEQRTALERQLASIQDDQAQIQLNIKHRQEVLLSEAQHEAKEEAAVPFWEKAIRIAATVSRFIPVGQPYVAGIGAGLEALNNAVKSDRSFDDITKGITTVFDSYKNAKFDDTLENNLKSIKDIVKNLDFSNLDNVRKAIPQITDIGKQVSSVAKGVTSLLKDKAVPKDRIDEIYNQLCGSDAELKRLKALMDELAAQYQNAFTQLNQVIQDLVANAAQISQNLLQISEVNQKLVSDTFIFDQEVASYVETMRRRAEARILKYQYFLGQSYEYRLVSRYSIKSYLTKVLAQLVELIRKPDATMIPTQDQINSLATVLQDAWAADVEQILTVLSHRSKESSFPLQYQLTAAQIASLNSLGSTRLDLARYLSNQEQLGYISDIDVTMTFVKVDPTPPVDESVLTVNHPVHSFLRLDDKLYRFSHAKQPLPSTSMQDNWQFKFLHLDNDKKVPSTPSVDMTAIICTLTQLDKKFCQSKLLFAHPSLWTAVDISFTNQFNRHPIATASLTLQYEYTLASADYCLLRIVIDGPDAHRQLVTVSARDYTDSRYGNTVHFLRCNSQVAVIPNLMSPSAEFDHWVYRQQASRSARFDFKLADFTQFYEVNLVYIPRLGADTDLAQPLIEQPVVTQAGKHVVLDTDQRDASMIGVTI